MSNLSENRINLVLTPADVATIKQNIDAIVALMPENTTLTDTQRASYMAINVNNKVYAENVLTEARSTGAGILAPYVNLDFLENDLTVFKQLDEIESKVNNLLQRVKDAKRIAGHEAYGMANKAYKNYQDASDAGVANAKSSYDKLKVRFDSNGNSGRIPAADLQ
ncbi:hypothetical protein FIA58_018745 [Flavobacterium jejuense]|uniref:Uncharacterized protein n=1 Tax=Flavobacterium jejuense TaxID=1544455 RepID=A0ABX0IUY8_9FLAO|nr:hypothetical protein [Flavobacterium jejuense]NHN27725.1 hypothetical protein [Flavobacterium jejuense]